MRFDPIGAAGRAADPVLRGAMAAVLARRPGVPASATALIAINAAGLDQPEAERLARLLELARHSGAMVVDYSPSPEDPLSAVRAGTTLEELESKGVERVLVAGFATNVAVDSTARHCTELDFETKVIADCCAAATAEEHRASIETTLPRVTHGVWDSATAQNALTG